MSILRDDRLVALHDLVEACRASAGHGALAAETMSGDARAGELQAMAQHRSGMADFFAERMIESDDMPAAPPAERNLLQTALATAKAAFADDGEAALLAGCRAREEEVLRCAEAAELAPLGAAEKAAAKTLAAAAHQCLGSLLNV
ncbi:MAG: hypothetical protein RH942_02280 [Kiloniellaceae bacterium]